MMKIDFRALANRNIRDLIPYQPGKPLEELERELGISSSIKLASNENPLGPSPKAIIAAQQALLKAHFYPDGNCFELKQSLAEFLSVQPNQITIGNGSENILELIVKSYLSQNDAAIIPQYAFLTIPIILNSYGIKTKVIPTQNWQHDIHATIDAIDANTRVVFIINPNNPTGTYVNETQFQMLLAKVPTNVLIVVDEAYAEYILQADYPNALKYLTAYPNLILTRTFSKAYGLAALRVGYAVSSSEIADILNRTRLPFNVNTIAAKAACAALNDTDHIQKSVTLNHHGMQQLITGIEKLHLKHIPSVANFITIDVHRGVEVYEKLLAHGVIVRPLKAYTLPNYIRVTVGTEAQNARFLLALDEVMNEIKVFE